MIYISFHLTLHILSYNILFILITSSSCSLTHSKVWDIPQHDKFFSRFTTPTPYDS